MAKKPALTRSQMDYARKRHRVHLRTAPKAMAHKLGVSYRTLMKYLSGEMVVKEAIVRVPTRYRKLDGHYWESRKNPKTLRKNATPLQLELL